MRDLILRKKYNKSLLGVFVGFMFIIAFPLIILAQSPYTIEVTIPPYDAGNSEHFLIQSKADWSHINDSGKRYFYVEPNSDYGKVTISADGTASAMRYISLYNGNDTHPAKLTSAEQANVRFVFNGANYWIVDRMSSLNFSENEEFCYEFKNSGNIVLNRFYLHNFYEGVIVRGTKTAPYTHDVTIQNSRFDKMSDAGIDGDAVAIMLMGNYWNTPGRVLNTKILNNEIKNCNDGIMPIKMPQFVGNGTYWVDYPGTIIDYNHIYVDTTVYTDGSGKHDVNGLWALTENAVDIKGGSNDANNPMIVSNNYFWGYRRTDQNGGGSGSWGTALAVHYHTKNLIIKNNVIFNSNRGLAFSGLMNTPYTAEDVIITKNILYDIGYETGGGREYCIVVNDANYVNFDCNTIVSNGNNAYWLSIDSEHGVVSDYMNVSCNAVISYARQTGGRGDNLNESDNHFYDTERQQTGDGIKYPSAGEAKMEDLTFTTDNLSTNPYEITLSNVKSSDNSPHMQSETCQEFPKMVKISNPKDAQSDVYLNQVLRWLAVSDAESYDVYFGKKDPPAFIKTQKGTRFKPDVMDENTTYYWAVDANIGDESSYGDVLSFTTGTETAVSEKDGVKKPKKFTLSNYPNPFNPSTKIKFYLPKRGHVTVKIYNIKGQEIAELSSRNYLAGEKILEWNGYNSGGVKVSSGIYICSVQYNNQIKNSKMVLMK